MSEFATGHFAKSLFAAGHIANLGTNSTRFHVEITIINFIIILLLFIFILFFGVWGLCLGFGGLSLRVLGVIGGLYVHTLV